MSSSVCRVCLCSTLKGHHVETTYLQEIYEKLTGTMLSTAGGRPTIICYYCNSQLMKSLRFFDMCQKSENIFRDLLHHDLEITQEALAKHNLPWIHNLSTSALKPVYIDELNNDRFKTETAEEIFVEIDPKQYVDVVEAEPDSRNGNNTFNDPKVKVERKDAILYSCEICTKTYMQRNGLKIHMRIHSGVKLYTCDTCNRSFGRKYTLELHMRTHTGEKPYTCNVCDRSFSDKGKLKRHSMQVHAGKPYTCRVCYKSFNDSSSLRCHMGLHTGEKSYTCNVCDKSFSQRKALTRHTRIHTDGKPYTCTVCGKSYTQNSSLTTHFKRTH